MSNVIPMKGRPRMRGTAREIAAVSVQSVRAVAVVVVVVFDTCMSVENGAYEPEPKYLRRWGVRARAVSSWMGMGMGILRLVSRHCRRLWGSLLGPSVWGSGGVESWILSPLHSPEFLYTKYMSNSNTDFNSFCNPQFSSLLEAPSSRP